MELGDGLRRRLAELEKRFPDVHGRLAGIARGATARAVETATELTPPNAFGDGEGRGVTMISDSSLAPAGDAFVTVLANGKEYASYVNDGHRVDKHFVPGLYIDADGLLSRDLSRKCGLVVGAETTYVEGLHITEQAIDRYEETVRTELDKLTREMGL